jgi:hypothetical protein
MNHIESMGDKWFTLGVGPQDIPGVVDVTRELGGTREVWSTKDENTESILMAWPQESLLRTSVVFAGKPEGQLDVVAVTPLMEGFANELKVAELYPWKGSHAGEILARPHNFPALWFYDPLYFRDAQGIAKDDVCKFYLSGLCFGLRRALLDEITVTEGPAYEQHALEWMKANPSKSRLDVPALKIPLSGRTLIDITEHCSQYQSRASIFDVDSFMFGPENAQQKIYRFGVKFGDEKAPVYALIYAPERVCQRGYVPAEGDEVDMVFWMQGRIVDDENIPAEQDDLVIPAPNQEQ